MVTAKDAKEFVALVWKEYKSMAKDLPLVERLYHGKIEEIALDLMSFASDVQRYNTDNCNRGLSPAEEERSDNCEKQAVALVAQLGKGFGISIQGDPRGAAFKLTTPSDTGYCFGNVGVPVPPYSR